MRVRCVILTPSLEERTGESFLCIVLDGGLGSNKAGDGDPANFNLWGERRQWSHSFLGLPQIWNLWEEEEAQPLHLLQSNLIMDCRFRRSRAVLALAIHLPNANLYNWKLFRDEKRRFSGCYRRVGVPYVSRTPVVSQLCGAES